MRRLGLLVALMALVAAAVAWASPGGGSRRPQATAKTAAAGRHALSETANHSSIHVRRGARLVVTLHSTYWRFASGAGTPVHQVGAISYRPALSGGCVPGAGCGTVTARFVAGRDGRATIRASRTSCGEAMLCPPSMRSYAVRVSVSH